MYYAFMHAVNLSWEMVLDDWLMALFWYLLLTAACITVSEL